MIVTPTTSIARPALPEATEPQPITFTFAEVVAALNPLHHLPVVGTIYRAATGETIPPVLRVIGGGIFGGPLGMLSAAVMAAIDEFRSMPDRPDYAASISTERMGDGG